MPWKNKSNHHFYMGLSIHYSGSITDVALIQPLTEEVQDVCTSLNWNYHLFDDEHFKGICFSPEECEPLFLTFTPEGILASPVLWQLKIEPITTIATKTQFAGIEAHIAVIKLLKHVQAKYLASFELFDEGGYWESDDEGVLKKQFDRYNFLLDAVCEGLQNFKAVPGETPESLGNRLERFLKERWKEN